MWVTLEIQCPLSSEMAAGVVFTAVLPGHRLINYGSGLHPQHDLPEASLNNNAK